MQTQGFRLCSGGQPHPGPGPHLLLGNVLSSHLVLSLVSLLFLIHGEIYLDFECNDVLKEFLFLFYLLLFSILRSQW